MNGFQTPRSLENRSTMLSVSLRCRQKQPFADVFQSKCSLIAILIGKHLSWSVFLTATSKKRDSNTGRSQEYCTFSKNRCFIEHLRWLEAAVSY